MNNSQQYNGEQKNSLQKNKYSIKPLIKSLNFENTMLNIIT